MSCTLADKPRFTNTECAECPRRSRGVEDFRSVYIYGRVGFLVTASFVGGYSLDDIGQEEPEPNS